MIRLTGTTAKLFLALQIPLAFACSGGGPTGFGDQADAQLAGLITFASDAGGGAFRAGAGLAHARIDFIQQDLAVRTVQTSASGAFSSALPPGPYTVRLAVGDGPPLEFALSLGSGETLFAEGRVNETPGGAFALNVQVFRDANADAEPDDEFRLQVLDRMQGDEESGVEDVVESAEDAAAAVTLCHVPPGNPDAAHTVDVGAPSVPAHLAHGDTEGACADDGGEDPEDPEEDPDSDEDSDGAKVLVCHAPPGNPDNAVTIEVGESALPAHLAHGDTEGACEGDGSGEEVPGGDEGEEDTEGGEETKVVVCHVPPGNPENPHTIEVGESAVPDHLAHGDTEGACADEVPPSDEGGEEGGEEGESGGEG
ncbi:MAG TPA: hypothetical protein VJ788_08225 [Gemmatimonadota bacterium]|nr:hypothetical protein [Gemmatimonadota bacterium]